MAARPRRPSGAGALALVAAAAMLLGTGVSAQQEGQEAFSAAERRRLAAGELVARRVSSRRGQLRLIGGNAWQVIDLPVEATWRALCDTRAYPHMLPATEEVRAVSGGPDERVLRIRHAVGFVSARYHLRMHYDHDRRDVSFRLDRQRPNDLRAAWGFLNVQPYEDDPDRTLVSYGVMADVGGGMIGGIMRPQVHEWILRVPETMRSYLHGSGRRRYARP